MQPDHQLASGLAGLAVLCLVAGLAFDVFDATVLGASGGDLTASAVALTVNAAAFRVSASIDPGLARLGAWLALSLFLLSVLAVVASADDQLVGITARNAFKGSVAVGLMAVFGGLIRVHTNESSN